MNQQALRRFADVRLGDTIVGETEETRPDCWESSARRLVQEWAGSDRTRVMHVEAPSPAATPRDLAARIYARHLDDSRCVTIEVVGRDRGQVCASAVIRVALG
jgi:hypothetical protein